MLKVTAIITSGTSCFWVGVVIGTCNHLIVFFLYADVTNPIMEILTDEILWGLVKLRGSAVLKKKYHIKIQNEEKPVKKVQTCKKVHSLQTKKVPKMKHYRRHLGYISWSFLCEEKKWWVCCAAEGWDEL